MEEVKDDLQTSGLASRGMTNREENKFVREMIRLEGEEANV